MYGSLVLLLSTQTCVCFACSILEFSFGGWEMGNPVARQRLSLCRARPFCFLPVGVEGPKYSSFGSRIIGASSFDSDMSHSPIAKRR